MAQHVSKREIWDLLQKQELTQPMGEPLSEVIAMFERVFADQPTNGAGPVQEVRVETGHGTYVWQRE